MCDNNVGSVVVSDGESHIVGIVTDRDLTCALAAGGALEDFELQHVMTRKLCIVSETADVSEVIKLMKERGIRRIPVVHDSHSGKQRCIGMVSLDDLLAASMISLDDVAAIIRAQVFRRRKNLAHWTSEELDHAVGAAEFYRSFAKSSGLSEAKALAFIELVTSLVVRRLHFTSAADFIDQLPTRLRSQLFDLPAGPDRSITSESILSEIVSRFDVDRDEAKTLLGKMWDALTRDESVSTAADLAENLPDDLRILFVTLPGGASASPQESQSAPLRNS
jgi:CBS domain-containing protein